MQFAAKSIVRIDKSHIQTLALVTLMIGAGVAMAGTGATTLPLQIYSMVRSGISPEINAASTMLLAATALILYAAWRVEQGGRARSAAAPAVLGLAVLAAPFVLVGPPAPEDRVLNVFIWSGYLPPETVKAFEAREKVRVNVDLYDSLEALLAKLQAGNAGYDVVCPSNYAVEILLHQNLLEPLDRSALPHLSNVDPVWLDREFDPGNRHTVPYFAGTCGIGYRRSRVGEVDSWRALWDPRWKGRILMLDDARETLGAALRILGRSVNTSDEPTLRRATQLLVETIVPLLIFEDRYRAMLAEKVSPAVLAKYAAADLTGFLSGALPGAKIVLDPEAKTSMLPSRRMRVIDASRGSSRTQTLQRMRNLRFCL